MKSLLSSSLFAILICSTVIAQSLYSPDKSNCVTFTLSSKGNALYEISHNGKIVVAPSALGVELKEVGNFNEGFKIASTDTSSFDETWNPVLGEYKSIRNHYNELNINLSKTDSHDKIFLLTIRFRAYDDGVGFRYEFPKQPNLNYFTLIEENTTFQLTGNHKTFWIPGDFDSQEYRYNTTPLSDIHSIMGKNDNAIGTKSILNDSTVQSPLLLKSADGLYISIFEAALINYPAMHLLVDRTNFKLKSFLAPNAVGSKAFLQSPFTTPWRTITASENAADIISSHLILNLNEPCKLKDVSWIKPQKFVGIWWEMHVGKSSWNYSDTFNLKLSETNWSALKPNGRHGATTERTMIYIDFASKHKIDGVLVEGWNIGWEDWYGNNKEEVFDFVTPYPDFDVEKLQRYAESKNVKLIMHHETSASATNYERRMDTAFKFMKAHGYNSVKTGYVGRIIPRGEHHDGQWMVNHYLRVAQKASDYKIMVDAHEPVRPTGLSRTYPNWIASEAARGNEFNAWSEGNLPEHETILPFARLLGGPMDYTPGIFQIKLDYYSPGKKEFVHTTLAKQLALYITMYSPIQMAADLPENYEKFPDAFKFIEDVAVDWGDTKILEAEPGDFLTIARKEKNSSNWFIGAITDENKRTVNIKLDFLDSDKTYTAIVYSDGDDAHYQSNPMEYKVYKLNELTNKSNVSIPLACGGGAAISIKEVE